MDAGVIAHLKKVLLVKDTANQATSQPAEIRAWYVAGFGMRLQSRNSAKKFLKRGINYIALTEYAV